MKHNSISQGLIADLIEAPVLGATQNGTPTARFKIAFSEVKKDQQGNNQFFTNTWLATAFNETAQAIARLPAMSTIMFAAKLDRYKAQDKEEYITRLVLFNVALVGHSDFAQFYQQRQQQNGNAQYPNGGFANDYDNQYAPMQQQPPQQYANGNGQPRQAPPQQQVGPNGYPNTPFPQNGAQQFQAPPHQQQQQFQQPPQQFQVQGQQRGPQPNAPMFPGAPQPGQVQGGQQQFRGNGQMPPPGTPGLSPLDDIPF